MRSRAATPPRILLIAGLACLAQVAAVPVVAAPPLLPARLVKDLTEDITPTYPQYVWPRQLTRVGNRLYFIASGFTQSADDDEVWVTDGTTAGTRRLTTLNAKLPHRPIGGLTAMGGRLFFSYGSALWIIDGATDKPTPLSPQSAGRYAGIGSMVVAGNLLYYRLVDEFGRLCRSDGTRDGTYCIHGGVDRLGPALGSKLFFVADEFFDREPWVTSDGESALRLRDIAPGDLASSRPTGWSLFDGAVFFFAFDGLRAYDLWRTDGTPFGTRSVADIDAQLVLNFFGTPPAIDLRGHLYFTASDPAGPGRLWRSDGTAEGTAPVAAGRDGLALLAIARGGGRLLALGGADLDQLALWAFDPAAGGSERLASVTSTRGDAIAEIAGRAVFTSCTARRGCEPWTSDGTVAGTYQMADVAPRAKDSTPTYYTRLGAEILFVASDGAGPYSLWAISAPSDDPCSGDCSGNAEVSIDELVAGIRIAMGDQGIDRCVSMDRAGDGSVDIDDLVGAAGHALEGCYQ